MPSQSIEPLPSIKVKQYNVDIYITKFSAALLTELFRQHYINIEEYQIGEIDSYQRIEDKKRIKELADFLINYRGDELVKPILPSTIIINVRDPRDINFDTDKNLLIIKRNAKLNIVDGQHRAKALFEAQTRGENLEYEVPVTIITNLERFQEAAQFLIINVKQKPVRTDLALTVLHELANERTGDFVEKLKKALKVDAWQLAATHMAISLNDDRSGPFHDLIIRPNEDRARLRESGRIFTPIKQAGFVDSLRRFAEPDYPDVESKVAFLKRFWGAVKSKYPDAFDVNLGKNYILLKGTGVGPMHILASLLYSLDKEQILPLNEAIGKLSEEYNIDFWLRKGEGAGNWGTSQKEFLENGKILAQKIAPKLFDIFDIDKLKQYISRDILDSDDKLIESAYELFDPFKFEPIEALDYTDIDTPGCYLLVSGTKGRIKAYIGQSHNIRTRLEDHTRPIKMYSSISLKPEELNKFESLAYHILKQNYRLNDSHPPLNSCPFCV